jgi:hypothetical protein
MNERGGHRPRSLSTECARRAFDIQHSLATAKEMGTDWGLNKSDLSLAHSNVQISHCRRRRNDNSHHTTFRYNSKRIQHNRFARH